MSTDKLLSPLLFGKPTMLDRYQGCFLGLSIGDALGQQVEFFPRGIIIRNYDDHESPWGLPPGGWTDDTSTALCLAESLIAKDTREQTMDRLVKWVTEGHNSCTGKTVGIGGTTMKTIMGYKITGKIVPPTDEASSGNGCIMRLAPVAIYHHWELGRGTDLMTECASSATLTHGSKTSQWCTMLFGKMLSNAFMGKSKEEIYSTFIGFSPEQFKDITEQKFKTKSNAGTVTHKFGNVYESTGELTSNGYCVNTLECALWAFHHSETFEEGMIKAISLGGDTDTIGAVYGQLAGAYYGVKNIPPRWVSGLIGKDRILELTNKLIEVDYDVR